mgnify:FL=1
MAQDLTAILMPAPPRGLIPDNVVNLVAQNVPPTAWVRLSPLEKLDIQQLEVLDGQSGLPAVSPSILVALSQNGGKAMFVHVNHQGKQALLHAFEDGIEVASYTGEPGDAFDAEVTRLVGHSIDDVVAEDDGTRIGFGQAATRTAALVRGRLLMVPPGTPTGLGSFVFHDRGFDTPSNLIIAGDAEADTTRAAFFAFDGNLIHQAFNQVPGSQLAQVLGGAPQDVLGPLIELRDPTVRALTPQQVPPGQAKDHPAWHTHTFELLALSHAGVFAGGDTVKFLDSKLLAILSIGDATPIIDADDAEELEELPSVLDAMIEVLPCPKPPGGYGPLFENIGPDEIGALVPWAKPGQPYDGAVFLLKPDRLLELTRSFDANRLGQRLEKFCRALYSAKVGDDFAEDDYLKWRGDWEQKSQKDIERLLLAWAELRVTCELAAQNRLNVGLAVYG